MRRVASLFARGSLDAPWTNVYGLARSVLAMGTLLTLLAHGTETLFGLAGRSVAALGAALPLSRFSLFELTPVAYLPAARWCAILALSAVVTGWRPRITGVLHWWVSLSFSLSCGIIDGGDQVTTVIATLLLPVALTDPRKWHWSAAPELNTQAGHAAALLARSAFTVIRLQVAAIYFHAAVGKLGVAEWVNGTAAYYWFTHPVFGLNQSLLPILVPVLASPWGVVLFTWGAMLIEVALFTGVAARRRWWPALLAVGLAFHFAILIIHGLVSFFFAMAGALILYLRPRQQTFAWRWHPVERFARCLAVRPQPQRAIVTFDRQHSATDPQNGPEEGLARRASSFG